MYSYHSPVGFSIFPLLCPTSQLVPRSSLPTQLFQVSLLLPFVLILPVEYPVQSEVCHLQSGEEAAHRYSVEGPVGGGGSRLRLEEEQQVVEGEGGQEEAQPDEGES